MSCEMHALGFQDMDLVDNLPGVEKINRGELATPATIVQPPLPCTRMMVFQLYDCFENYVICCFGCYCRLL
jgi:hypothetical protein